MDCCCFWATNPNSILFLTFIPYNLKAERSHLWFPVVRRSLDLLANQPNLPLDPNGCYGRQLQVPPKENIPRLVDPYWAVRDWSRRTRLKQYGSIIGPLGCQSSTETRPTSCFVRLPPLACIYLTCFPINCNNRKTLTVDVFLLLAEHPTYSDVQRQPPWWATAWCRSAPTRSEE